MCAKGFVMYNNLVRALRYSVLIGSLGRPVVAETWEALMIWPQWFYVDLLTVLMGRQKIAPLF